MDDGATHCASKEDVTEGTTIAIDMFAKIGLIAHVGTAKKASKTEAVFSGSITLKKWRSQAINNRITNTTHNDNSIIDKNT